MNEKALNRLIWVISIITPLAVAVLLNPRFPKLNLGFNTSFLPLLNAMINSTVGFLLMLGLYFIRNKKNQQHKQCMIGAFVLSIVFLISYVFYHLSAGHTPYCSEGLAPRSVYYFTLISHIIISAFIIPLAAFTIKRAAFSQFEAHKILAKITWPLWLYVSITGVLVYILNSPCYA